MDTSLNCYIISADYGPQDTALFVYTEDQYDRAMKHYQAQQRLMQYGAPYEVTLYHVVGGEILAHAGGINQQGLDPRLSVSGTLR